MECNPDYVLNLFSVASEAHGYLMALYRDQNKHTAAKDIGERLKIACDEIASNPAPPLVASCPRMWTTHMCPRDCVASVEGQRTGERLGSCDRDGTPHQKDCATTPCVNWRPASVPGVEGMGAREQFEAFVKQYPDEDGMYLALGRLPSGSYAAHDTQDCWNTWQAARSLRGEGGEREACESCEDWKRNYMASNRLRHASESREQAMRELLRERDSEIAELKQQLREAIDSINLMGG